MYLNFHKSRSPSFIALFLLAVFILGILLGSINAGGASEDRRFRKFTDELFQQEVSGSMLTLHYSLAYPEKKKISRPAPSLGTVSSDMTDIYTQCRKIQEKLKTFRYSQLSHENQITYDMLLLYFHTRQAPGENSLLEEVLSPSLGIQAQLPVLLAEYAFYEDQDIADYLNLLLSVEPYFQSILKYEQEKAAAGFFMSDTTLDRILKQCQSFIQDPDSNYMLEVFSNKLKSYGKLSKSEQNALNKRHREILLTRVIPAYQQLMTGLSQLRGSGHNTMGLSHFQGGQKYYQYLINSETGSYDSVQKIQQRLLTQLNQDTGKIRQILREQPSLLRKIQQGTDLRKFSPKEILQTLRRKSASDFPELNRSLSYEIRYVHKSMRNFLSPAFYLTPPLDTGTPNVIYINPSAGTSSLELFTTLAHEGFPGHLYQTVFFANCSPSDIRYLISCSGYVEGWATYAESCSYQYAADYIDDPAASDFVTLCWLNRSVNLCIYSLADIGIHYQGWTPEATASFLKTFGVTNEHTVQEIYQYIVETPGNYLKYYVGYLNFNDLKVQWQEALGKNFDPKEFHREILETGPVPFPVLKKYMNQKLSEITKEVPAGTSLTYLSYNCQKISVIFSALLSTLLFLLYQVPPAQQAPFFHGTFCGEDRLFPLLEKEIQERLFCLFHCAHVLRNLS